MNKFSTLLFLAAFYIGIGISNAQSPPIPGTITGNTTVCSGTANIYSIQSVPGASFYNWLLPSGWNGSLLTDTSIIATPDSSGSIIVTANNMNGSSPEQTLSITVNPSPAAQFVTSATTLCAGTPDTLMLLAADTATGTSPFTFTWHPGGDFPNGANTIITPGSAGVKTWKFDVADVHGCTAVDSVIVTINSNPKASFMASSTTLCAGTPDTLMLLSADTATGTSPFTFTWHPGGTFPNGANTIITPGSAGVKTWKFNVTDLNGCTAVDSVIVTVNAIPASPAITVNGSTAPYLWNGVDVTFCNGDTIVLTANDTGTVVSYLWSNGATTSSVSVSAAGNDSVLIIDGNGCMANSLATTITVNPLPGAITGANQSICSGLGANLGADSTVGNTYLWIGNDLSDYTIANPIATPTSTAIYSLTETITSTGCSASNSVIVTVNSVSAPGIMASATTLCTGTPDTLIAVNPTFGSAPFNFTWHPGGTNPNGDTTVITPSTAGLKTWKLSVLDANGCTAIDSMMVTINALSMRPTISASGLTTFCQGDSVILTVTDTIPAVAYLWSNSATTQSITVKTAGKDSVMMTDAHGCSATSVATAISVNAVPDSISIKTINPLCGGNNGSIIITGVVGGTSPYVYSINDTLFQVSNLFSSDVAAGFYAVTVKDSNLCMFMDTVTVMNTPGPSAFTSLIDNDTCYVTIGSITVTSVIGGFAPYTYSLTGNEVGVINPPSDSTFTGLGANTYTVTVKDHNGCAIDSSISVTNITGIAPPKPTITGNTKVIIGSSNKYKVKPIRVASSYTWTLPSGWSGASTTDSIIAKAGSNSGYILVTANDSCGSSIADTLYISSLAGIRDNVLETSINFYPNPTSGKVIVQSSTSQVSEIEVDNLLGERIYQTLNTEPGVFSIDLSSMPSGMYFIRLTTNEGAVVKKITKQ